MRSHLVEYFKINFARLLILMLSMLVIFIGAGRMDYWQGWLYIATSAVLLAISYVVFLEKLELLKERIKPGPGVKWWDRIFIVAYIPACLATIFIASLDAGRFRWSPELPTIVYVMSSLIYMLSTIVSMWAMFRNRFYSSAVRIQTDRGHHIIDDGPYRYIRHPGYHGMILSIISVPFILGSLWAIIPAVFVESLLITRAYLEDKMLQKELAGYAEYASRVKYRILPFVW
jgi:protein-S-isoprenylcysteine O-methyltransferase Ste14